MNNIQQQNGKKGIGSVHVGCEMDQNKRFCLGNKLTNPVFISSCQQTLCACAIQN